MNAVKVSFPRVFNHRIYSHVTNAVSSKLHHKKSVCLRFPGRSSDPKTFVIDLWAQFFNLRLDFRYFHILLAQKIDNIDISSAPQPHENFVIN